MKNVVKFLRRSTAARVVSLGTLIPSLFTFAVPAMANPSGGVVTHGVAEFNVENPAHLQIHQMTDKAIINWESFSIENGEITQFFQPGASSAALNRVVGVHPSVLNGLLTANGKLLLVNQNGILVGPSGVVDVFGGFTGSTLDIDDADFLNGGDDRFHGPSTAAVTNYGTIKSAKGDIFLIGHNIDNQGTIGAVDGRVGLAAGGDVLIKAHGDERVFVNAGAGNGTGTGVNNAGSIVAAAAELKAHGNVFALAINNSGLIRATGAVNQNGRVLLSAGAMGGNITNTGAIEARNVDGSGGEIVIDGGPASTVDIAAGKLDANGLGGLPGGAISVMGENISIGSGVRVTADGGDGGSVRIGSTGTDGGTPTASVNVGSGARVSASGSTGDGGTVLVAGGAGSQISIAGQLAADGAVNGGLVHVTGGDITTLTGSVISANGEQNGGSITVEGQGATTIGGQVLANGANGKGGLIAITGADSVELTSTSNVSANGGVNGGTITVDSPGDTMARGTMTATGGTGIGGTVNITGDYVEVSTTASIDASGGSGGGQVNVGGGFQGNDSNLRNSSQTVVGATATIKADALNSGNGGNVVIWSDGDTTFNGAISARALGAVGNGGFVEVSGKNNLWLRGTATASAVNGAAGTFLVDPANVTVGDSLSDTLTYSTINTALQGETNFIIATTTAGSGNGNVTFRNVGQDDDWNEAIQWNTSADFGVFATGDIYFLTHVRNAGSGSVTVVSGWDGSTGLTEINAVSPEDAWAAISSTPTSFGNNSGSVYVNDMGNGTHVEVGSRYGDTNVAAYNVLISGASSGTRAHAQLGFHDSGAVFVASGRINYGGGGTSVNDYDLTVGTVFGEGYTSTAFDSAAQAGGGASASVGFTNLVPGSVEVRVSPAGTPVIYTDDGAGNLKSGAATVGTINYATGTITFNTAIDAGGAGVEVAFTKDSMASGETYTAIAGQNEVTVGGQNGVALVSSTDGALYYDPDGIPNSGDEATTFVPYSDHWMDSVTGNYWWHNLDDTTDGMGNKLPENGATGDITVLTRGALIAQAGTGTNAYVQIGHGGYAQESANRGWDGRDSTDTSLTSTPARSVNWSTHNRAGASIARLADVEGDITIRTGIDPATGLATNSAGLVLVQASQSTGSQRYALIGHLGSGQFGGVTGNIDVDAGGDVTVRAGSGVGSYASIGHTPAYLASQDPREGTAQVRYFNNTGAGSGVGSTDFNNATLRNAGRGAQVDTTLSGNVTVTSNGTGGISVRGGDYPAGVVGNRSRAFAKIGHGGMADSNLAMVNMYGDIVVNAISGAVDLIAGEGRGNYAMIGHGGYNMGQGANSDVLKGDITVTSNGDLVMSGGNYPDGATSSDGTRFAFAQIGHGGFSTQQQHKSGDITVTVNNGDLIATGGVVQGNYAQIGHGGYSSHGQVGGDYTRGGSAPVYNGSANISISVDGDIVMDHMASGDATPATFTDQSATISPAFAYVLFGHGGQDSDRLNTTTATGANKNGDVTVIAGGDITMNNGDYQGYYTQIGHGGSANDDNFTATGNLTVTSQNGSVILNAAAAAEANQDITSSTNPVGVPAMDNAVRIGHGGAYDNDNFNGNGDIIVTAAENVELYGGNGYRGSQAQIGHGTNGNGDDDGIHSGNISVNAGQDLILKGGQNAYTQNPSDIGAPIIVEGAHASIGHGGYRQDGNTSGDINVTVGHDLIMEAGSHNEASFDVSGVYAGQIGAFVRIGNGSYLEPGTHTGNITVQAGHDLLMTGAQTPNEVLNPIKDSFVQIGNGGASVSGNASGEIVILVGNDLITADSDSPNLNDNYVKIGHGDWMKNTPDSSGAGLKEGNITISVGNSAVFDHTLVGHVDPWTQLGGNSALALSGNTYVGVSRNNPFHGGPGTLTSWGSVFTSGLSGAGTELRFYIPSRSNNLIDSQTRLNEDSTTYVGTDADFAMPSSHVLGSQAAFQRADEIYLQPDLWWDNNGVSTVPGSSAFPNGAIATVGSPGGYGNLTGLAAGSLGDGTSDYNADNAVSGAGRYTFYYDAIEDVPGLVTGGSSGGGGGTGGDVTGGGDVEVPEVELPVELPEGGLPEIELPMDFLAFLNSVDLEDFASLEDLLNAWNEGLLEEENGKKKKTARQFGRQDTDYRIYMIYDLSVGAYNSLRLFGIPDVYLPIVQDQ